MRNTLVALSCALLIYGIAVSEGIGQTVLTQTDLKSERYLKETLVPIGTYDNAELGKIIEYFNDVGLMFSEGKFEKPLVFECDKSLKGKRVHFKLHDAVMKSELLLFSMNFTDFYSCLTDICHGSGLSWNYVGTNIVHLAPRVPVVGISRGVKEVSGFSCLVGVFDVGEAQSAIWTLKNDGAKPVSISSIQRSSGCLVLNYRQDGCGWMAIGGSNKNVFKEIAAGDEVHVRVSIPPFGVVGPFAKNVYVWVEGEDNPIVLTIAGVAIPPLTAYPSSPLRVGAIPRGVTSAYDIALTPPGTNIVFATPYVTNTIIPAICSLATNSFPWILRVSLTPATNHRGPIDCDVIIPFRNSQTHSNFVYRICGNTTISQSSEKKAHATTIDYFYSWECTEYAKLERDIFIPLERSSDYRIVRHNIDLLEEAKQLKRWQTMKSGKANEPLNVVVDDRLFEGETAIREKFKPWINLGSVPLSSRRIVRKTNWEVR